MKVPKKLTDKDLSYIKDMFNWNLITAQKITFYNEQIANEKILNLLTDIANVHYDFCTKLTAILAKEEPND